MGFLQNFSKAGKNQKPTINAFFYNKGFINPSDNDSIDKSTIKSYLKEIICRKRLISIILNNKIIKQYSLNIELYDLCLNKQLIFFNQANKIINLFKSVKEYKMILTKYFIKIYSNKNYIYYLMIL